jgi:imidazoleglycerol phosphate synthase cyclase subunit
MPAIRIIPCLDVKDGRVVKGVKFQGLRDAGDPREQAAAYEAQGADELVILDVSATVEGRETAVETVRAVREVLSIPLTVGGGVREVEHAAALLDAGADKVGINSAAVDNPPILTALANRFGRQCVVLAIDAAETEDHGRRCLGDEHFNYEVVVKGGRQRMGLDAVQWAVEGVALGAGEILLTSWDRDGTHEGFHTGMLYEVCHAVPVPVIASGGASAPADFPGAFEAGATGALAASIFHDGTYTVGDVKRYLQAQTALEVRP